MKGVLEDKPIRTYLKEREPLLPHKKIVDVLGIGYPADYDDVWGGLIREFAQGPPPPILDRVRPEEAIEVMAGSSWAHGLAEGVCGPKYVGLPSGSPEYDRCVYNVSHKVAARSLRMEWTPPPTPTPAVARPRRRSVL